MSDSAATNPDHARLDEISAHYDPADTEGFEYFFKRLQVQAVRPWLRGDRVLELGCATGELTAQLAPLADEYHVVEGSALNIEAASARVPTATFVHSLWEEFRPTTDYSDVLLVNALEHAEDPAPIVEQVRGWLQPGGRVHVMVPNGSSLHRLVGVELGMLETPTGLSEGDRLIGHFRNYTMDSLAAELRGAGFTIAHWQGIFLKLLSNAQMADWDWDLVAAIDRVAQRFTEHCAVLYAVCE